ncbi:hypothetical protein [Nocardioides sp. B-3]|uniref:hypothetical protein n=1 Tax=Nocardioides sp. B-3 TaxID=2895565 RepID=UPI00215256E3|nr:hypothetical protein [Nocardioides sp. B-3]UUZ61453.1 hypothetical protein LP418_13310 [Nocardioides sp. B-3]
MESLATSAPKAGDLVCVTGFSLALAQTGEPLLALAAHPRRGRRGRPGSGLCLCGPLPAVREEMLGFTDVWSSNPGGGRRHPGHA